MDLSVPDYAVLAVATGAAVVGLFVGFSGALAFLAGLFASVLFGFWAWPVSEGLIVSPWARGLAVGVASLLVFGLVRWLVRRFVHGLVAQPGDALLGMILSALTGLAVTLGIVWCLGNIWPDSPGLKSVLLEEVLVRVGC